MNVLICDDERRDLQMVRLHVEQFGKDRKRAVGIWLYTRACRVCGKHTVHQADWQKGTDSER